MRKARMELEKNLDKEKLEHDQVGTKYHKIQVSVRIRTRVFGTIGHKIDEKINRIRHHFVIFCNFVYDQERKKTQARINSLSPTRSPKK